MEYFGLKLQTLRKQALMSQDNLAELMGVSRQAISKWERSEALPDLYNVKKIAEIFQVTIDELVDTQVQPTLKTNNHINQLPLAFMKVVGMCLGAFVFVAMIYIIIQVASLFT